MGKQDLRVGGGIEMPRGKKVKEEQKAE